MKFKSVFSSVAAVSLVASTSFANAESKKPELNLDRSAAVLNSASATVRNNVETGLQKCVRLQAQSTYVVDAETAELLKKNPQQNVALAPSASGKSSQVYVSGNVPEALVRLNCPSSWL